LSIPREKRKTMVKKYVAGVVVVHVVNHRVTRVLEEKVDDMPAMGSIEDIGAIVSVGDMVMSMLKFTGYDFGSLADVETNCTMDQKENEMIEEDYF
jgi:hypothetical protein